jgi:Family of unknown function (DUF5681)
MTQDSGDDDREAEAAPYEVGYGRPPKATRFKPGKSGNPGGRPKGSGKSRTTDAVVEKMKALVLEEAYRPIQIRDGDQLVELPVMQAVLRSVALQAAKGQQRAQRMLIDVLGVVEGERRKDREKLFGLVVDYKQFHEKEIALARRFGVPEPSPLPHPDSLIVDPFGGSVILRGPWTAEEKEECDKLQLMKRQLQEELGELTVRLERTPTDADLQRRIAAHRSVIARLDAELKFERVIVPAFR